MQPLDAMMPRFEICLKTLNARAMALRDWRLPNAAARSSANAHTISRGFKYCLIKLRSGSMAITNKVPESGHPCNTPARAVYSQMTRPSLFQVHFTSLVNRGDKIEEPSGQSSGTKTKHEIFVCYARECGEEIPKYQDRNDTGSS